MEAVLLHSSPDQSHSPYKLQHIRNSKKNNRPFISRPSENFAPPNFHGGLLCTPPPFLSYSFPPSVSFVHPQHVQRHHQPPLLPLPNSSKPYNNNSRGRGLSCPPINKKINNRTRDQSLTPKKSKVVSTTSPKKEEHTKRENSKSTTTTMKAISSSECLIIASTNRLGPDPKDLPKDVSGVLSISSSGNTNINNDTEVLDTFSGSVVFTLSPPPSSLPLPTFSLRPRLSCSAEATGIDAGATDSLRRLLRLR